MDFTPSAREAVFTLRPVTLPVGPVGLSALPCQNCHEPLDIHQPDPDLPERMLATCPACRDWYLVDYLVNETDVIVLSLPDIAVFRDPRVGTASSKEQS